MLIGMYSLHFPETLDESKRQETTVCSTSQIESEDRDLQYGRNKHPGKVIRFFPSPLSMALMRPAAYVNLSPCNHTNSSFAQLTFNLANHRHRKIDASSD